MKIWLSLLLFATACGTTQEDLCDKYQVLYPDLVSGRVETRRNTNLVKGVAAYSAGNYELAISHLTAHSDIYLREPSAYIYKAVSQLELGKPYDAELTLDKLEGLPDKSYADQIDYYNLVCLICSGQTERALEAAKKITEKPHHSYLREAQSMVKDLAKAL